MASTSSSAVDVLIIGGGPSGLAAAMGLCRALYTTVVFDSGVYRNALSRQIHALPTWDRETPAAYRDTARTEIEAHYDTVQFADLAVKSVIKSDAVFVATDASGKVWTGKKVVLATGVTDSLPEIQGYAECWGTGMLDPPNHLRLMYR